MGEGHETTKASASRSHESQACAELGVHYADTSDEPLRWDLGLNFSYSSQ